MGDNEARGGGGLWDSLARLAETGVAILQTRLELLSVEFQQEKARLIGLFLWGALGIFLAILSVTTITFGVIMSVWETAARPYVVWGFSALYVGGALIAFHGVRQRLTRRPPPFSATLAELKKDRAWLRGRR